MGKFNTPQTDKFQTLADSITENLDVKGNVVTEKEPHKPYYDNLPEGVTVELVETISDYNSKFITASHVAVGQLAADIFRNEKDVHAVHGQIGFNGKNDNIEISVDRSKTYRAGFGPNDNGTVTKNLCMTASVNTKSTTGHHIDSVRKAMQTAYTESIK